MIDASFSYFDAAVIAVMVLSCLVALVRGFVKEMLSLGAWVGAGMITIYFFPDAAERLKPKFNNEVVAAGMATLGLYVGSLLGFSLLNALILRFLKEGSDIGPLDNSFGLIFGAVRGAFIVSLGYFVLSMGLPEKEYPVWLAEARTRPMVERGAIWVARLAPPYLSDISSLKDKIHQEDLNTDVESEWNALESSVRGSAPETEDAGTKEDDRLQRLFDSEGN